MANKEEFELGESYDFWVSHYNNTEEQPDDNDLKISKLNFNVRESKTKKINLITTRRLATTVELLLTIDNPDNIEEVILKTTTAGETTIPTTEYIKINNNQYTFNLKDLTPNTEYTTTVTVGRATDKLVWSTTASIEITNLELTTADDTTSELSFTVVNPDNLPGNVTQTTTSEEKT